MIRWHNRFKLTAVTHKLANKSNQTKIGLWFSFLAQRRILLCIHKKAGRLYTERKKGCQARQCGRGEGNMTDPRVGACERESIGSRAF